VPTLLGVSIGVFLLVVLTPGDPARAIAGPYASAQTVAAFRAQYHLSDPLPVQYIHWLGNALRGDLGQSPNLDQAVGPLVVGRFANTCVLVGAALLLAFVLGILIGVYTGSRPSSKLAQLVMALNAATANVPPYLSGLILVLVFSTTLHWLPSAGMHDLRSPGGFDDLLRHLLLPAIAVAAQPMLIIARMTRASILEVARQEYVLVARATGIAPWRITWQYILWNALPPVVSVSGLQVGALLSGALFAEVIFTWPGLGNLLYTAVLAKDVLTIQAVTLVIALTFVAVNLLTDVVVGVISPRSRLAA
jgi:peptide/nickel transport system permease protein